jgi:hypothetical protein
MHSHFQILLRGVLGVVRKSGRGSSIFVFYCIFMIQFFKVYWKGTWGVPLLPPPPVCIYGQRCANLKLLNFWAVKIKNVKNDFEKFKSKHPHFASRCLLRGLSFCCSCVSVYLFIFVISNVGKWKNAVQLGNSSIN